MNKTLRAILIGFVALVLVVCGFGGGFAAGRIIPSLGSNGSTAITTNPPTANPADTGTPADLQNLFTPFWEAWNIVHQEYLVQPLDDTKLMQGAIRGMMEALGDKHSSYMDPQEFSDANAQMQGEYAGIGAYVDTESEYLTIIRMKTAALTAISCKLGAIYADADERTATNLSRYGSNVGVAFQDFRFQLFEHGRL